MVRYQKDRTKRLLMIKDGLKDFFYSLTAKQKRPYFLLFCIYPFRGRYPVNSPLSPTFYKDNVAGGSLLAVIMIFVVIILFILFVQYVIGIDVFSWLNESFKTIMYRLPI